MARVALLITVLAAVAYISQAIPVSENVEDEQLNSKEIQPEFNENIDQIQSNEDILGQDQPEFNDNHDQIQPKSEESSSQLDDTSEQLEDSKNKNKNSQNHNQNDLKDVIDKIKKLIENNENRNRGIGLERKLERLERLEKQRSRQNSRYTRSTDENQIKVNDTSDFKKILKNQINLFKLNIEKALENFLQIISDTSTNLDEDIRKEIKETKNKFDNYKKEFFDKFLNKNIINIFLSKIESIAKEVRNLILVKRNFVLNGIESGKELIKDGIETGKELIKDGIETGKELIKDGTNLGKSIIESGKKEIEGGIGKIEDIVQKRFEDSKNTLRDSTNIFFPLKIKRD